MFASEHSVKGLRIDSPALAVRLTLGWSASRNDRTHRSGRRVQSVRRVVPWTAVV